MSHALATPPAADARGFFARLWAEPDTRSTTIGIVGVVLIHLLLWLIAPQILRLEAVDLPERPASAPEPFSIEIAPEVLAQAQPKAPNPFKFVETNPDAPENTPDKTDNFSDRNTQVAQEKPTPDGKSDRPATEGKKDFESNSIVSGQLSKPREHREAVPPPEEVQQQAAAVAKAEQNPLPGFEKKDGEDKEAFGSNIARFPDNARPIPERIDGAKNVPLIQGATVMQPTIDRTKPRARPQLVETQNNTRPAFLAQNNFGTKNIGPVAFDAKWSAYGEYLARMIEAIDQQWRVLLAQGTVSPQPGTYVTVTFIVDAEGKIVRMVNVDSHTSAQGVGAACSAITDRAPYGPWTDDMKAVLGQQQELTFRFFYD